MTSRAGSGLRPARRNGTSEYELRFQVLTAASMKMTVFWDVWEVTDVSGVLAASAIMTIF
jgi:hypothetical protein